MLSRLKVADLTSGLGALVLGVGLGALFQRWFGGAVELIIVAGLVMHALGMWDKHRLESVTDSDNQPLVVALYWICWVMLAGVLAVLVWSR